MKIKLSMIMRHLFHVATGMSLLVGLQINLAHGTEEKSKAGTDVSKEESEAFAESFLANRAPANNLVVSGSVQARKRYPGGADEDDLQVQAVLPNPSRGLEAHDAAVSEAASAAQGGEAPASD